MPFYHTVANPRQIRPYLTRNIPEYAYSIRHFRQRVPVRSRVHGRIVHHRNLYERLHRPIRFGPITTMPVYHRMRRNAYYEDAVTATGQRTYRVSRDTVARARVIVAAVRDARRRLGRNTTLNLRWRAHNLDRMNAIHGRADRLVAQRRAREAADTRRRTLFYRRYGYHLR